MTVGQIVHSSAFGLGAVREVRDPQTVIVEFNIGKKQLRSSFLRPATPEEAATYVPPPPPEKLTGPKVAAKLIKLFKTGNQADLLEHILAEGALVIELGRGPSADEFKSEYFEATGQHVPDLNSESVHVWDDRWGNEYRVTFPEPDFILPDICTSYQTFGAGGKGRLTINSKELFWFMIEQGMRLADPD